jgi:hypothetical protein
VSNSGPSPPKQRFRILQEEFVKPGDLGEHLQIGEVLGLEVFVRALRVVAGTAEALPQLAIARVAANHVDVVGLEQVLQGKAPLFWRQVSSRLGRDLQEGVLGGSGYIVLHLHDQ